MTRTAHLWFLLGVLLSLSMAIGVLVLLAIVGAIRTPGEMIAFALVDAVVAAAVVHTLFKRYRSRKRMHERVSRELRCGPIDPNMAERP